MLLDPVRIPLDPDTILNSLPTPALIAAAEPEVVTESSVRNISLLPFLSLKLIDDDYNDKSIDYLKEKREDFINLLEKFNSDAKDHIKRNLEISLRKRKSKKVALLLCFPFLGFQWFYFNDYLIGVISFLCCWTIIAPIINLIHLFQLLFMSQDKFDVKYNPEYSFYSQFNLTK